MADTYSCHEHHLLLWVSLQNRPLCHYAQNERILTEAETKSTHCWHNSSQPQAQVIYYAVYGISFSIYSGRIIHLPPRGFWILPCIVFCQEIEMVKRWIVKFQIRNKRRMTEITWSIYKMKTAIAKIKRTQWLGLKHSGSSSLLLTTLVLLY